MQVNSFSLSMVAFAVCWSLAAPADAGPCACNPDITGTGLPLGLIDIQRVIECAGGNCSGCVNDCDVDCDGDVDYFDAGAVACAFQNGSNCCAEADGACDYMNPGSYPPCIVTTDNLCFMLQGTWHGDLSACEGNNAIDIPAASTWGLSVLALATLIAATILIQRNRRIELPHPI